MGYTFGIGVAVLVSICLIVLSFAAKYNATARGFFLMDRTLSLPLFVVSMLAANLSIGNFLIFAAIWGYAFGWGGLFWFLINLALNALIYFLFVPKFRWYLDDKTNAGTVHEFLALSFGGNGHWQNRIRVIAATATIAGLLFAIVFELHITAGILAVYLKVDPITLFLTLTALICLYSAIGGFHSLVVTDVLNSLVMLAGGCVIVFILWTLKGPHPAASILRVFPFSLESLNIGLWNIVSICALGGGWFLVAMDQWQRTCAMDRPKQTGLGMGLYCLCIVMFAILYSFVGVFDRTLLIPQLPIGAVVSGGSNPLSDLFLTKSIPAVGPALLGVLAIAMFSAAMSTANTFLIVCGHSFSSDVWARKFDGCADNNSQTAILDVGRSSIVGMGGFIIGTWLALNLFGLLQAPIRFFFVAYSVQFALLAPLVCVRLPDKLKPSGSAVYYSVWVGIFVSLLWGLGSCLYLHLFSPNATEIQKDTPIVLTPVITWASGTLALVVARLIDMYASVRSGSAERVIVHE